MVQHYFSSDPGSLPRNRQEIEINKHRYEVVTQGGVFSASGLDKGTAVLLRKVPFPHLTADSCLVDLGCGWGPITLALAAQYPQAKVLATDINKAALELTKINAEKAGFHVQTVEEPVARAQLQAENKEIDLLLSNPPIRIGKEALHILLKHWLKLLSPTGQAFLVVQRNLGADSLSTWLKEEEKYDVEKIGSAKGYRVLRVCR